MPTLTPRQTEILAFIRAALTTRGVPPTRAEIGRHFGFRSPKAAEDHLRALARRGVIELMPGVSRGIRVLDAAAPANDDAARLPLIGRVAAGAPVLAVEHVENHYAIDPRLFRPRADYLLRVTGHSMIEAGILDNDLVAVHRTTDVTNGQIVVARVDHDEVTVKRLRRHADYVELLPENPAFEPIRVDPDYQALAIEGLIVGVIRNGVPA